MVPWRQIDAAEEQRALIRQWQAGGVTIADLARHFSVSRKTAHKRIRRFRERGWDGVGDLSRAPHTSPTRTLEAVRALLVAAKLQHPAWGPKQLVPWLAGRHPGLALPSVSTAGAIVRRHGLVRPRRRRRRTPPWSTPFAHAQAPNDVWCVDFKGWSRTGDGTRCDPLTVSDAATRYFLACRALARPGQVEVRRELERVFRQFGLPGVIRTDNGPPFASVGLGGLSELAVWWLKLGIRPERIAPAQPQQNSRHERLHRTLMEQTARPPARSLRAQQRAFDRFVQEYNQERPHEALGQRPPAAVYQLATRPYPDAVAAPTYPATLTVRRGPLQRRNQMARAQALSQRRPARGAGGAGTPRRRPLDHPLRTPAHRAARRAAPARVQNARERVTHVLGLTVTYVPDRTASPA